MSKQKSRALPYRVYMRFFQDCTAHDYHAGKIVVDLPEDYIESKMYTPDGWNRNGNRISCEAGRTGYGTSVSIEITERTDVIKYYEVYVTVGNVFCGGTQKSKTLIRNFQRAVDWATETAQGFIR